MGESHPDDNPSPPPVAPPPPDNTKSPQQEDPANTAAAAAAAGDEARVPAKGDVKGAADAVANGAVANGGAATAIVPPPPRDPEAHAPSGGGVEGVGEGVGERASAGAGVVTGSDADAGAGTDKGADAGAGAGAGADAGVDAGEGAGTGVGTAAEETSHSADSGADTFFDAGDTTPNGGLGAMSAEDWKKKGNAAYEAQDYDKAVMNYSNAIERDPTNAALFSNRSAAYLKLGDYSKARFDADQCIDLNKSWAKGWWRRGQAELEAQEYFAARETFREGLKICRDDGNLIRGLGDAEKRIAAVESVQGPAGPAEFDPDAPSMRGTGGGDADAASDKQKDGSDAGGKAGEDGDDKPFPGTAEEEIDRIRAAPNHYAVLHVSPDATAGQLKKNYHILARMLHPDKCKHPAASEAMGQVSLAYDTLTNVVKRTLYDQFMSQTAEGEEAQTYAEWEAKQQPVELPKWLAWILQIKGCGWILAILMSIILLPVVLLLLVVFLVIWCVCCPYRMALRYCFPEKYARMKEEQEKERAKVEEAMQDAHV